MDYKDTPKYIMHFKPAPDGNGTEPLDVYSTANGVNINGTEYYSKAKVDELVNQKDSELRSWATQQFQAKA